MIKTWKVKVVNNNVSLVRGESRRDGNITNSKRYRASFIYTRTSRKLQRTLNKFFFVSTPPVVINFLRNLQSWISDKNGSQDINKTTNNLYKMLLHLSS